MRDLLEEFDAHLREIGDYELIRLPSGELTDIAEVYRLVSFQQYWEDFTRYVDEVHHIG